MPQTPAQRVSDFKGENRLQPDDLLPDNVSPDAQNCDYSRGTIRKRDGYSKLHPDPVVSGGVFIQNAASARHIHIPHISAYQFSSSWSVEIFATFISLNATIPHLISNYTGSTGFALQVNQSSLGAFLFDSGGTIRVAGYTTIKTGVRYHIIFGKQAGGNVFINVNGTVVTAAGGSGLAAITAPLRIATYDNGAGAPAAVTDCVVIDELRIWSAEQTEAVVSGRRYRELNSTEIASSSLVGYWRFNESKGPICIDESVNMNHGTFMIAGPCSVPGIIPDESGEGAALRFDGVDDTAAAAYSSQWATIMNTGTAWTVEAWVRLDNPNHASAATIFHLGSTASTGAGQQGPVFQLRFATTTNALQVLYATSTTATATITVGYTAVPGVPFHIAIIRAGVTNITVYINGVLYATSTTGLAASTGPTTSTTYGFYLGAQNNAGTYSVWAPVTIDEVRLWKSTRSSQDILNNMMRELPDSTDDGGGNLVAYWRMNTSQLSGSISILDETGLKDSTANALTPMVCSANTLFTPGSFNIRRAQGLVYPSAPDTFQLVAPLVRRISQTTNIATAPAFDREILAITRSTAFSISGSQVTPLMNLDFATADAIYDHCYFNEYLIATSGANTNYKYDGTGIPHRLSLSQPAALAAASNGSGGTMGSGVVQYKVAFRNSRDGTESLGSATASVTSVGSDKINLTSIPTYSAFHGGVDQRVIYRTAPGGSIFYLVGYIYDNATTTATDTSVLFTPGAGGGAAQSYTLTSNALYDANNGDAPVCRYCCTHIDRVFVANSPQYPSAVYWTEANSHYKFTATNILQVTPGDGDEITGLCSAFGGLLIFKRYSIHFLSGYGNTTFDRRQIVSGRGCVAGQTIAQSPYGVYFMATDGVYRIDSGFAINPVSGFSSDPQSFSQQNIFRQLNTKRAKYSTAVYDAIQHQYIVSFDCGLDINAAFPWMWYMPLTDGTGTSAVNSGACAGVATVPNNWVTDSVRGTAIALTGTQIVIGPTVGIATASYFGGIAFGGWFYVTTLSQSQPLWTIADSVLSVDDHALFVNTDGSVSYLALLATGSTATISTSAAIVAINTWYHVFATFQQSTMTIYINGQPIASTRQASTPLGIGSGFYMAGGWPGSSVSGHYLSGRLQYGVGVINTPVTKSDIAYLYRSQLPSNDLLQKRITLAYYEERNAWAYWDKGFDYLSGGATRSNQFVILAGKNGYVNQIKSGYTDGAGQEGSQIKLTGTVTSDGTVTIVDSAASFPVAANGQGALQGCYVTAQASASAPYQTRLIVDNTATTLYLDKTFAPTVAGTYTIAGIDWYWTSRYMDMGDSSNIKRWFWMQVWQKTIADGYTVTFTHRTDQYSTWQSTTFTTAAQLRRFLMQNRGRKLQIKFANAQPQQPIDIEAFQAVDSPHRWV